MGEDNHTYEGEGRRKLRKSRRRWRGLDRINLAQDVDRWRILKNTAMNICVP